MLHDIADHPDASITEHYRNLGWSAGRGNRVKEQLLEMRLVICARQQSASGRPRELLAITIKGKDLLHAND